DLDQGRWQRIENAEWHDPLVKPPEVLQELAGPRLVQDRLDELPERLVPAGIWIRPARVLLRLARGLQHVVAQAGRVDRPRPDHRLVEQVFLVGAGRGAAVDGGAVATVHVLPARDGLAPFARDFREHVDAHARVLTALG